MAIQLVLFKALLFCKLPITFTELSLGFQCGGAIRFAVMNLISVFGLQSCIREVAQLMLNKASAECYQLSIYGP